MASNLFKTTSGAKYNGGTLVDIPTLTNANCVYVHTYVGDDTTGDGTKEYPYRSASKAILSSKTYVLFRGVINEYFSTNKVFIGDDINQTIISSNYNTVCWYYSNCTADRISSSYGQYVYNVITTTPITNYGYPNYAMYHGVLQKVKSIKTEFLSHKTIQSSLRNMICNISYGNTTDQYTTSGYCVKNTIITDIYVSVVNSATNWVQQSRYCLIPSDCVFYHDSNYPYTPNLTLITPYEDDLTTPATFGNDSVDNIRLIRNGYKKYNSSIYTTTVLNNMFFKDIFGNETCKIIKEQRNGGSHPNIFNRYDVDNKTPIDWTLNPNVANEALWASDTGGYVGCFNPSLPLNSVSGNNFGQVYDVYGSGSYMGTNTTNTADLMVVNSDDTISFQVSPNSQTWNRCTSNTTITIPNGSTFKGITGISNDGSPFGHYIGKHQNLVDGTVLNPGDTLTVNSIYKVCNTTRNTGNAIIYNGVNYLPDYFFRCVSGVTTYSLLTEGSGTVVKKLLTSPLESVEIIPYDDVYTQSSTYPKFSCPIGKRVSILQYSSSNGYGKTAGTPVLFGDSTFCTELSAIKDKIAYYDSYAITNADQEFYTLQSNSKFKVSDVYLKYLRVEINGHFDVSYDY